MRFGGRATLLIEMMAVDPSVRFPFPPIHRRNYIGRVISSSLWSRILTLAIAFPAIAAISMTPVAHGVEHGALQPDAVERHVADHGRSVRAEDADHHHRHAHPDLDATISSRSLSDLAVEVQRRFEFLWSAPRLVAQFTYRSRVKAHGAHAPPPNLRGPPSIG